MTKEKTTRERLLQVGADEFSAKGFAGARVETITRKARCSKQVLYYYYGSKKGLYLAVLAEMIDAGRRKRQEHPLDVEEWALTAAAHRVAPADPWARLWLWESLETGGKSIRQEEERTAVFQELVTAVRDAQQEGKVSEEFNAADLALVVFAASHIPRIMPQVTKMTTGMLPNDPVFTKRYADTLRQLLRALASLTPEG